MRHRKKEHPDQELLARTRIEINGERWFTYQQLCMIMMITPATMYGYVREGVVERKRIDSMSFYRLRAGEE